jgi:PKD repeat protein
MKKSIFTLVGISTVIIFSNLFIVGCGSSSSDKKTPTEDTTKAVKPIADYTFISDSIKNTGEVSFKNNSQNATSYSWNFGDSTEVSKDANPSHTYAEGGNYTVVLKAIGPNGENEKSIEVNVKKQIKGKSLSAGFEFWNDKVALNILFFRNTSKNATSFLWNFGDNATSKEKDPSHNYEKAGKYTVTLTATGSEGKKTYSQTIDVRKRN